MTTLSVKRFQKLAGIIKEQMADDSPEARWPSREDEEETRDKLSAEEDYSFAERLPAGMENDGFNAVVIADIGEELQTVEATPAGLRKAQLLSRRLQQAIDALQKEIEEV